MAMNGSTYVSRQLKASERRLEEMVTGHHDFKLSELEKIAELLNMPMNHILDPFSERSLDEKLRAVGKHGVDVEDSA